MAKSAVATGSTRLITPFRPMSLEAAPGKNPVSHIGKIYNVLAKEIADAIAGQIKGIARASVLILSSGRLVSEPQVVAVEVAVDQDFNAQTKADIEKLARTHLGRVHETSERLIRGEIAVF